VASSALAQELILGRYRPLRPLGSGGMGHVWLARDERNGLDVSLKMVPREGRVAERAEREARAAAALRHPRCQRIYALARDTDHIYIAYEYIPGRTLRQALAAGALTDADAVEAAAQVLDALAHAHRRGIVHRDVKPSNVLVGESDEIDVRLLDFGLAQMAEFDTLTAVGDVPGTLTYVSPERLRGEAATPAADVWAVGVMLWEALAGHHPFRSSNAAGTSQRIRAGAAPLESIRPDLPDALCATIACALDLDPERRPTAAALAAELRNGPKKRRRRTPGEAVHRAPRIAPGQRSWRIARERALPAAAAGIWTAWATSTLPFYPAGWPLGLTVAVTTAGLAFPRAALGLAFAVTFFPLGNVSLGLALFFAAFAVLWTAATWTDPRGNVALVAGPLLGPLAALALLPLVAQLARGAVRRAVQTAGACLLAVLVAGLRHLRLPLDGSTPPLGLGITGSNHPAAVGYALARALSTHHTILAEAAILAVAAAAFPYLRGRGLWVAAAAGAALLAATALAAPSSAIVPLIGAAWLTAAALALVPAGRTSPRPAAIDSTHARSGPTRKRYSRLRSLFTTPTFSPRGL
jgi:eukaryotic-like serine/threonine-protein kinase